VKDAATSETRQSKTLHELSESTKIELGLKQAIAYLSESDFRSAAATEPAGLV
jgi:hypothetical protein